jgi:hypothetical protein
MSKIISTLPSAGSTKLLNVAGSNPTGGKNPMAAPVMPGWNPHDASRACGQQAGAPKETIAPPQNGIPGKTMPHPAEAAPAFPTAGRDASVDRESN